MRLFADACSVLGGLVLPLAAGLLLEELTLGGLVRLLLAPWPGTRRPKERSHAVPTHPISKGDSKCSR